MRTMAIGIGGLTFVALTVLVAADSAEYTQHNVCPGGLVGPAASLQGCVAVVECAPLGPLSVDTGGAVNTNFGGVMFCPGHIAGDENGQSTITVSDDAVSPVAGVYCQDLDDDSICGEPVVGVVGVFQEPRVFFCGSVVIESPIDLVPKTPADWALGNNWEPASSVLLFVHAPGNGLIVSGLGAGNPCGTVYAGATHGTVDHT